MASYLYYMVRLGHTDDIAPGLLACTSELSAYGSQVVERTNVRRRSHSGHCRGMDCVDGDGDSV